MGSVFTASSRKKVCLMRHYCRSDREYVELQDQLGCSACKPKNQMTHFCDRVDPEAMVPDRLPFAVSSAFDEIACG